jgi:hypothetical protein
MVTLEYDQERTDGVTLVRVYVEASTTRRVRVENRLDGPVWPPRRHGQPAAGWDEAGFEGVVGADDRLVAGYATPAAPADPPVELVADEPADGEPTGFETDAPDVDASAAGVVRSLGDPLVPRDAVPVPDPEFPTDDVAVDLDTDPATDGDPATHGHDDPATNGHDALATDGDIDERDAHGEAPESATEGARAPDTALVVPGAVRAWLSDVEARVAAVENGADPDAGLETAVASDRRALARVARRAAALSERIERADGRRPASGSGADATADDADEP